MKKEYEMKKYRYSMVLVALLAFTGCDVFDESVDKVNREADRIGDQINNEYDRAKSKYEEYRGEILDKDGDGEPDPKPFTVVYQENPNDKVQLISSRCGANAAVNYVYYNTPADTNRVLQDIKGFISYPGQQLPYWDIRYVNPISKYINGGDYSSYPNHSEFSGLDVRTGDRNIGIGTSSSELDSAGGITLSECVDGLLAGGTTINLNDAPNQYINYGGPQSTFIYQLGKTELSSPWKTDGTGNLVIQSSFDSPIYINYGNNTGAGVYFSLFLKNRRSGELINYIIGLYAVGDAWIEEKRGIRFDPTINIIHVATVASDYSWWSTKSPASKSIQDVSGSPSIRTKDDGKWNDFFRVNIAYQNLLAMLQELKTTPPAGAEGKDFGLNPAEWDVTNIMIQYELEEKEGKALFSGSFHGFEAYTSHNPI
jgi:hypothetical protein